MKDWAVAFIAATVVVAVVIWCTAVIVGAFYG